MISDAFLSIATYVLGFLALVFPEGSGFPTEVHSSASVIGGYARTLDPVLPFDTLATVLLLLVAVELAVLSFRAIRWMVSHIPFIGGRG